MAEKQLIKKLETKKSFNYSKGSVNLSFTLDVGTKKELETFSECLEQALKDINETISNI